MTGGWSRPSAAAASVIADVMASTWSRSSTLAPVTETPARCRSRTMRGRLLRVRAVEASDDDAPGELLGAPRGRRAPAPARAHRWSGPTTWGCPGPRSPRPRRSAGSSDPGADAEDDGLDVAGSVSSGVWPSPAHPLTSRTPVAITARRGRIENTPGRLPARPPRPGNVRPAARAPRGSPRPAGAGRPGDPVLSTTWVAIASRSSRVACAAMRDSASSRVQPRSSTIRSHLQLGGGIDHDDRVEGPGPPDLGQQRDVVHDDRVLGCCRLQIGAARGGPAGG